MKKTIYLFRHGQTDWNIQGRYQGDTDVPLNEEGHKQAKLLRELFAQVPCEIVFSSPLTRAIDTAAIATDRPTTEIKTVPGLQEVELGEIEGMTLDQIHSHFGQESMARWMSLAAKDAEFTFPHGENRILAAKRLEKTLLDICRVHDFSWAAVCSHGLLMRRFFHYLQTDRYAKDWNPTMEEFPAVKNCMVYVLECDTERDLIHLQKGPIAPLDWRTLF